MMSNLKMGVLALGLTLGGCVGDGGLTEGNAAWVGPGFPAVELGAGVSEAGSPLCSWEAGGRGPQCVPGTVRTFWMQDFTRADAGTCWTDAPWWRNCESCGWQYVACEPEGQAHRPEASKCTGDPEDFSTSYEMPRNVRMTDGPAMRFDFPRYVYDPERASWDSSARIVARPWPTTPRQVTVECERPKYATAIRLLDMDTDITEVRCFAGSDGRRLDCETREDWTEAHGRQCTKLGVGSVDCETGEAL